MMIQRQQRDSAEEKSCDTYSLLQPGATSLGLPYREARLVPPLIEGGGLMGENSDMRDDRVLLTQDRLVVSVTAPEDDRIWLREFFGAPSSSSADGPPQVDIALADGLDWPSATPVGSRLAFALDSGPVRLPAFPHHGGERLLDLEASVAFDVDPTRLATRVRYGASRFAARVRLMRVVREYFHNHALQRGHLVLHAAAVVYRGKSVLIAGRKGSGKTTTMLRLLAEPETAFLSNDRVLVEAGRTPQAIGVPTVIALRGGTLKLMPQIAMRLASIGDFRAHGSQRAAGEPMPPVVAADATRINAQQLCEVVDRPSVPSAPLAGVIALDESAGWTGEVRRLDGAAAARMLTETLLGSQSGVCASEVFVGHEAAPPSLRTLASRCEDLAALVPCYRAGRLRPETAHDAEQILALCVSASG
jgi:hypothetical protein